MSKVPSYNLADFGWMIDSHPRMEPYAEALRQTVTPGCRVIDIGAGPGIFSILACRFGAGSVVAIDPNQSIELAATFAAANGCADRITLFKGMSTDYSGEPADVIVSDIRGILPFFEFHISSIADARMRLLAPGGKLIPSRDRLRSAIVTAPKAYHRYNAPWLDNRYGLDLSAGRRFVVNTIQKVSLGEDCLLSEPHELAELDYYSVADANLEATFDFEIKNPGTAHGILVWFDAELADGIGFSNAPGQPPIIYGQTLFPFERPVEVQSGDRVSGTVGAIPIDGNYTWSWTSSFARNGQPRGIDYRQSTFLSTMFDPDALAAQSASEVPAKRPIQDVVARCMALVDGKRSLDDIAKQLAASYPAHFASYDAALNFAARITARDF